jgi:cytochrome oxidase Cu insertion factor (SCO1/SenC/PrrC family)
VRRRALKIALGLLLTLASAGRGAAVQIGGPFELVDQHDATRTDADFRGSYLLIYFGFTYCPDLCPTTLLKVADALEELAALSPTKAERVVPVFISVDPERDTPEALRGYAEQFDPRLVALTGTPRALAKVGRKYGVFSAKVLTGESGGYVMDHTSFLYLMGPDGKYVQHFESDVSVDDLVGALERSVVAPAVGGS